jgi:sugar lactone lactonase YvrE
LVFAPDGTLFVGDRSGTIFKVTADGRTSAYATLPSSVAAFHLALGPEGSLYVTGPTLASRDAVYRVSPAGEVSIVSQWFGRPQGLAFDAAGELFVVEALAGASGLYRVEKDPGKADSAQPELTVSGPDLIGVAFDRRGGLVLCSSESAYRFAYQVV